MMSGRICTGVALVLLLLSIQSAVADNEQTFGLFLRAGEAGFQELELDDEVFDRLVGHPRIRVAPPHTSDSLIARNPRYDTKYFDPDLLMSMAGEIGVRYIVWLEVKEAGIKQADRTIIPFVFSAHHRKYVLGVRMLIVDSFSGKTVLSEYYEAKKRGSNALSYLDDDPNDPALLQKYSIVKGKFSKMEEEVSEKIAKSIVKVSHRR